MRCHNLHFLMEKYGKLSLSCSCYPFLSGALIHICYLFLRLCLRNTIYKSCKLKCLGAFIRMNTEPCFVFRAVNADITILNEVGVDPGIDHMLAMQCFDEVKNAGGKVFQ